MQLAGQRCDCGRGGGGGGRVLVASRAAAALPQLVEGDGLGAVPQAWAGLSPCNHVVAAHWALAGAGKICFT